MGTLGQGRGGEGVLRHPFEHVGVRARAPESLVRARGGRRILRAARGDGGHLPREGVAPGSGRAHAVRDRRGGRDARGGGLVLAMRVRLHWKILVATVLPLLLLTAAALWTSNRSISTQAQRNIREDLLRSATVFED